MRLEIIMRFGVHSGLHTMGDRAELWTDKALAVDWHDPPRPVVPATSIKGWLRENAERALRGLGQEACDGSQPATVCGRCVVCRVFGAPRMRSPLRFEDAVLEEPITDVRTGVSLSRYRRTAYEERLFSTEVAWSKTLTARASGLLPGREEAAQAMALLWLAASMGSALGAARSRGLGGVRLETFAASCDGAPVQLGELRAVCERWLR